MNNFEIDEKVLLNIASSAGSTKYLDDDGTFMVTGTVIGFTAKRIKATCDWRDHDKGYALYLPKNVHKIVEEK